jgi:catechol 2,3-dioxygenase-like lactoylglutathione lyase family enzyme
MPYKTRGKTSHSFKKVNMKTVKGFIEGFEDFQHVTVTVSDIDKSMAFYRDLLGFPVLGRLNYHDESGLVIYFLDIGRNALLEIFSFKVPVKPSEFIYDDHQRGLRHICFKVKDASATALRLKKAGVEFTLDPWDIPGGGKVAFFKSPDGVLLEILQFPVDTYINPNIIRERLPVSIIPSGAPGNSELTYEHTAMTVSNLDRALELYQGVLGFPVWEYTVEDSGSSIRVQIQVGNSNLELFSFGTSTIPHPWNPDSTVLGLKHIGLLVEDVDAVAGRLERAGVKILYPPVAATGNVKTCFFADPDGNGVELIDGRCTYDRE